MKNTNETINVLIKIITALIYVGMFGIGIWYIGTYGVEIVIGFGCVMAIYFLNAIKDFINDASKK